MRDLVSFFDIGSYEKAMQKFGLEEIVFVKRFSRDEVKKYRAKLEKSDLKEKVKFCNIVERGKIKSEKADYIAIEVKELKDLNAACDKRIRFIIFNPKAQADLQAIKKLASANKEIVFSFRDLLSASAFERMLILKKIRFVAKLAKKAKANIRVYSLAKSFAELRNPKSLRSILACLGD